MAGARWRVALSQPAERDILEIIRWTAAQFGGRQAGIYRDLMLATIRKLRAGPMPAGARARPELGDGLCSLSVARRGKPGRHFLLYRAGENRAIDILRVLHQGMDIERHRPLD